ncbi:hypothetical protein Bhyg_08509 [Pseudolycoriella hygida]|uniref:Uncharacterized protein n=1 Tax=Pseudolycoriella hygida TaxID=35572 RepID=A0A9Q0N5I4_9DIPT|nr:hypothetical protein Bhyg_08509 [Pseudolycoriella hygida]
MYKQAIVVMHFAAMHNKQFSTLCSSTILIQHQVNFETIASPLVE